jgi:hypothetical protein
MIYVITSRRIEIGKSIQIDKGVPLHIKVPTRGLEEQPYLGFTSRNLGEKYLELKDIPTEDLCVVTIDDGLNEEYKNRAMLIFENEKQIIEMENDIEGYDYESQIHENAL